MRPLAPGGRANDLQGPRSYRGAGHPSPNTGDHLYRSVSGLSVDAGQPDCGAVGEDSRPTTVCPPWGEFDRPDVAQAAGDADSGLSNHTTRPAVSTPSAEVVQQPPHGPSATQRGHDQGHSHVPCSSPLVAGQHISAACILSAQSQRDALSHGWGAVWQKSPGGLVASVKSSAGRYTGSYRITVCTFFMIFIFNIPLYRCI